MKLLRKKSTYVFLGLILIAGGAITGLCGFGMTGFDTHRLPQGSDKPWYQTIAVVDDAWWFGVEFGGGAITSGSIPIG